MKILVISLAGIGDTLLATPLIHELKVLYPQAQIDALILWAGSLDILQNNPHLHQVFQIQFFKETKPLILKKISELRKNRYDLSFNAHPQSRVEYRMIARMIGARQRFSHIYECSSVLDRYLSNRLIPQSYELHTVENNRNLLSAHTTPPVEIVPGLEIFLTSEEQQWAHDFLDQNQLLSRFKIGFHVGSGGTKNLPLKRWPLQNYLVLLPKIFQQNSNVTAVLFGGPQEEADHRTIQSSVKGPVFEAKTSNLRQTAALMKQMDAFISVDTVLMHLGACMRVKNQMVIEAPTLNKTNEPYQQDYILIQNPMVHGKNLDYYRYDGKDIKGSREHLLACMNSIQPEMVLEKLLPVINQASM